MNWDVMIEMIPKLAEGALLTIELLVLSQLWD